jgi:hypothetical protein
MSLTQNKNLYKTLIHKIVYRVMCQCNNYFSKLCIYFYPFYRISSTIFYAIKYYGIMKRFEVWSQTLMIKYTYENEMQEFMWRYMICFMMKWHCCSLLQGKIQIFSITPTFLCTPSLKAEYFIVLLNWINTYFLIWKIKRFSVLCIKR